MPWQRSFLLQGWVPSRSIAIYPTASGRSFGMMITIPAARSGSGSTAQIFQADIDRRQVGLFQRLVQQLPQLDFLGLHHPRLAIDL